MDAGTTTSEVSALANDDDAAVVIPGTAAIIGGSIIEGFTGSVLNTVDAKSTESMVTTNITPFRIQHITSTADVASGNTGFKLAYQQVPC